ncbi:MAG: hypothetical protein Q9217_000228 [Psora testacea]
MDQYKGRIITDYFKTYSQPLPQKRPFPSDSVEKDKPETPRQSSSLPIQNSTTAFPITPHRQTSQGSRTDVTIPAPESMAPLVPNGTSSKIKISFEPPSKQTSSIRSSQRIIKNDEVMIRNSDDESGSENSSLEDLDALLNKHRELSSTAEPALPYLPTRTISAEANRRGTRRNAKGPSLPQPLTPAARFTLQALAKQRREYESSKEEVARTRYLLEAQQQKRDRKKGVLDEDLIDEIMQDFGEVDDIDRLKTAIRRTEALYHEHNWSFFNTNPRTKPPTALNCPSSNDGNLSILLCDKNTRQQTFLSGFMEEYVRKAHLPEDLLLWILDSSYTEPRDDLRQAYANTLRAASDQINSILTVDCLNNLFLKIGAYTAALNPEEPAQPQAMISDNLESHISLDLLSLLEFLRGLSQVLRTDARIHAISILCRLFLDKAISNNGQLISSIDQTLTDLLQQLPDSTPEPQPNYLEIILFRLYKSTTSPSLRVQLLRNLPLISPEWLYLRRQLALSFFFSDTSYLNYPPRTPFSLCNISAHLSSSTFDITHNTDYATLTSSLIVLDIAIDAADRPATMSSADEKAFNDSIDTLAAKVKSMFMQIIDSGASNMRRTEAKEVLEGFHSRLVYAVRTKPPPRKMIFGDKDEDLGRERKGMKAFMDAVRAGKGGDT